MKHFKRDLSLRFVKLLNIALTSLPFIFSWMAYYSKHTAGVEYTTGNIIAIGMFVFLYVIFARIYDAFLVSINRISEMIYSQSLAFIISDAFMFVVIWLLCQSFPNILPMLACIAVQFAISIIWSVAAHKWYYSKFGAKKSAVVYSDFHDF